MISLSKVHDDLDHVLSEYFAQIKFPKDAIFVLGCSSSQIVGDWMGSNSRIEVGQTVIDTIENFLKPRQIHLAIQGCQHINRALLVEREVAEKNNLEIVSVVPAIHAGGSTQVAAYESMSDPVEVEHITAFGGIDIGGTEIGMHVKFVQIPVQTKTRKVGAANVVCLSSRPKLIGGKRAWYEFSKENIEGQVANEGGYNG